MKPREYSDGVKYYVMHPATRWRLYRRIQDTMSTAEVVPFTVSVSDDVLDDLRTRLNLARFPQNVKLSAETEWSYGTPAQHVQDLVNYWKTSFNWRNVEADINTKLPQFTMPIDAEDPHGILTLHFVHKRSPNPKAVPLLFSHGWPGSFLEVFALGKSERTCQLTILKGDEDHKASHKPIRSEGPCFSRRCTLVSWIFYNAAG